MFQAIVLAGGLGTRLRGVVADAPKAMARICGRPFLEILLDQFAAKGFGRIVLSLGYMAQDIVAHFGNNYAGMQIDYSIEDSPLGTGGAVRLALGKCDADHVFVFNGDTYLDLEVAAVEQQWQLNRRALVVCRKEADTTRYGRVLLDGSGSRLLGFIEKGSPGPGLINAGCYVFGQKQLDGFPAGSMFSLELDYLAKSVRTTHFDVFVTSGHFIDIGIPEDFARAQVELAASSRSV